MTCLARQVNDQMVCGMCGLQWDVNDPEPPVCGLDPRADNSAKTLTAPTEEDKPLYHPLNVSTLEFREAGLQTLGNVQYLATGVLCGLYLDKDGYITVDTTPPDRGATPTQNRRYTHYTPDGKAVKQIEIIHWPEGPVVRRSRLATGNGWLPWTHGTDPTHPTGGSPF